MTTGYIADTGVFIRAGGPTNDKYRRLRNVVRRADASLLIPQEVFNELRGDSSSEEYPSGTIAWQDGIDEGWIIVAEELEHSESTISSVMDATRRFIANHTGRNEDDIEKADVELVGLAASVLDAGDAETVVLLTTDKPAGQAAERILPAYGFQNQIEYRYVSTEYLEKITPEDFSDG